SDSRRSTTIIMRAILHDDAPNTYYGQWIGEKPRFAGLESKAIAHNELAATARFVTFDVRERDFPGNRSPLRWKFLCRPKRKSARLVKWRASSDDHGAPRRLLLAEGCGGSADHRAALGHQCDIDAIYAHTGIKHVDMPVTTASLWAAIAASRAKKAA
ncbi:MAG: hypothetical protein JSS04_05075, partial [Proteobacteria bacterium]|nr:hypothetical protein [Pseudomonadota bacterium]